MSKLVDLVPPLELCQQIPIGSFDDSALWYIWSEVDQKYILCSRGIGGVCVSANPCPCGMRYNYAAPTLEEILVAIASSFDARITCEHHFGLWKVDYSYYPQAEFAVDEDNPVIAALRVWLELEREKREQQG